MNQVRKFPAGSCQFKIHLHTTQEAFIRLSHESQYQEFPWLQAQNQEPQSPSETVSLLPLAMVETVGLKIEALILN